MAKGLEGWHALLNRQLQRLELGSASSPDLAGWQAFIDRVSRAYEEADEDRYLMERSQALASEEMASLNEALRQERDLLETRVAERTEALRLSEARLASLVSLSSDWVWEQDTNGRLTYLSEGAMVAGGMPVSSLLGRRAQELDGFECDERTVKRYLQALADRQPFRDIVHGVRGGDGSPRFCRISGEPVLDAQGVFTGYRGVHMAIDDFGTGTSSLSLIHRGPAQSLKVDRSFVGRLPEAEAMSITRGAIALAHGMGMRAVAEGVESAQQLETLRGLGCDDAQGYFFGRPLPADAFAAHLRR